MNNPRPFGKLIELACHPIIKACPHSNQEVTLGHGKVGVGRAVHPQHTDREDVIFIKGTLAHEGCCDRNLEQLRQLLELGMSPRRNRAAANIEQGSLRLE